jgi:hypothetical protein
VQYLKELMDAELSSTELTEKQKANIKAKYAKEIQAAQMQELQQGLQYANQALSTLGNYYAAEKEREVKAAGNNRTKIANIERQYQQKMKRVAIGQAIINTALAITDAWGRKQPLWAKIVETGLASAAGIVQLSTINSQSFAKGGIVTGRVNNAIIGEYQNIKNDPEIVSPLSKLTEMLGMGKGEVVFKIQGTELVGVLNNQQRKLSSYN